MSGVVVVATSKQVGMPTHHPFGGCCVCACMLLLQSVGGMYWYIGIYLYFCQLPFCSGKVSVLYMPSKMTCSSGGGERDGKAAQQIGTFRLHQLAPAQIPEQGLNLNRS
jgi:hypothetical protein